MFEQPVVIVDPVSSGREIAPAFRTLGIPCLAVVTNDFANSIEVGYGPGIRNQDFVKVYSNNIDLVRHLKEWHPQAIIAGSESGVPLADQLAFELTPHLANDILLTKARRHKGEMQNVLAKAGIPSILTFESTKQDQVEEWLKANCLTPKPLIVKPCESAGSNNVFHVQAHGDWRTPFETILCSQNELLGTKNQSALIQEQLFGTEFAVDTVSANGRHYLAHLIRYQKKQSGNRSTLFDHTEFIAYDHAKHAELIAYTFKCLDALGIKWGAAHSEVMLTDAGPRLIETGARLCGGPAVNFARAATGSSQLERLIQVYTTGDVSEKTYYHQETVVPIFINAFHAGFIQNLEILDSLKELETHFTTYSWLRNGDYVERTVDFDSIIGIVALKGEREAIFADYAHVRQAEKLIAIHPS